MSAASEEIRIRYLYRGLVLRGKTNLSFDSARGLIGPDCAFHLYSIADLGKRKKTGPRCAQRCRRSLKKRPHRR